MGDINNYHSTIGSQAMYNRTPANSPTNLEGLSGELEKLLAEMIRRSGSEASQLQQIQAVKSATECARNSNPGGVKKALQLAGRWTRAVATEIGVKLVVRAMTASDDTAP